MAAVTVHDISMPLETLMPTYPGVTPYRRIVRRSMAQGSAMNVSDIEMCTHTGTHVDAPFHAAMRGATIDNISLSHCCGPAHVIDCRGCEIITAPFLRDRLPRETARILLKTDNSQQLDESAPGAFRFDAVYLAGDGAAFLADSGVLLVGIDALTIDKPKQPEKPSHAALLQQGILVLEGIILTHIEAGAYFLVCAPLKLVGSDGAPCRALLIDSMA